MNVAVFDSRKSLLKDDYCVCQKSSEKTGSQGGVVIFGLVALKGSLASVLFRKASVVP